MCIGINAESSLEEIAEEIRRCRFCILHKNRKNAVPGEGSYKARLILIGEAPGSDEDAQGRPFVGRAGRILDDILKFAKLERSFLFITSVVKCRPPYNRTPKIKEKKACLPYLNRQIELINPKIICLLGKVALNTLLEKQVFAKARGKLMEEDGQLYFSIYHPAAVLYNVNLKSVIRSDIKKIKELLENCENK